MTASDGFMTNCDGEECAYNATTGTHKYKGALCKEINWCQCENQGQWPIIRESLCFIGHHSGPLQPFFCGVGNGEGFMMYTMSNQNQFTRRVCYNIKINGETCRGFYLDGAFASDLEKNVKTKKRPRGQTSSDKAGPASDGLVSNFLQSENPTAKLFRTEQVRPVSRDAGIPAEHLDASSYFSQDAESHEEAYGGGRHPIQGPEAGLHG